MPNLTFEIYGKTHVRLLQVLRHNGVHEVVEIDVTVLLEGNLADCYLTGNNSQVLPTDTMKNTVYALARQYPIETIEDFASRLGRHFLNRLRHVSRVKISITQTAWDRIGSHDSSFVQSSKERRNAQLFVTPGAESITCGLRNLQILKTSRSAFVGFLKDEYTTLPETGDRLMGTVVDADWTLASGIQAHEFNQLHQDIRRVLLDCFSIHDSLSVQHTLYAMADAVLKEFDQVLDIHLTMPNKHCLVVDLSRFGLDNPNQIFVPTDEPSGYIEARVSR